MVIAGDQVVAGKHVFRFDQVWPGSASQEQIYDTLVRPLVNKVTLYRIYKNNFLVMISVVEPVQS